MKHGPWKADFIFGWEVRWVHWKKTNQLRYEEKKNKFQISNRHCISYPFWLRVKRTKPDEELCIGICWKANQCIVFYSLAPLDLAPSVKANHTLLASSYFLLANFQPIENHNNFHIRNSIFYRNLLVFSCFINVK